MARVVYILIVVAVSIYSQAQDLIVDWKTRTLTSYPIVVDSDVKVQIRVIDANDIFYVYSIKLVGKPRENFDFDLLKNTSGQVVAVASQCGQDLRTAITNLGSISTAVNIYLKSPVEQFAGKECKPASPCSLSLRTAQSLWQQHLVDDDKTDPGDSPDHLLETFSNSVSAAQTSCKSSTNNEEITKLRQLYDANETLEEEKRRIFDDQHLASREDTLSPDTDYELTVTEFYVDANGPKPTTNGTYTVTFNPKSNRLTFSAGALFSGIANRTYANRIAPDLNDPGKTRNILAVDGPSIGFNSVGLFNYQLPWSWANWKNAGLALSSGPVLKIGNKSDTSAFGYFGGLSLHLYHRVFISFGAHVGEFADFPAGFGHSGQTVPTGINELTPTKKTIARFGFALTYKAHDFSSAQTFATLKSTPDKASATAPSENNQQSKSVKPPKTQPSPATGLVGAAAAAGTSMTATSSGNPNVPPALFIFPKAISVGELPVGTMEKRVIKVSNNGSETIELHAFNSGQGVLKVNDCGVIQPGAVCTLTLTVTPVDKKAISETVDLVDQDGRMQQVQINVTGK